MKLLSRRHTIDLSRRPLVMGIVNLSADSFSGDGVADIDAAVEKARALVAEGADIIDVGAESARTNRGAISEQEEMDRLGEFLARWGGNMEDRKSVLVSINTWRPIVAAYALLEGGHILNDIGGLPTDENACACAALGAALVIMHTVGEPKVAHTHVGYADVMDAMDAFFTEKLALAEKAGLPRERIILDPGIDFAKQRDDNLRIYRELERLHRFERPLLLPVSRKTVIGDVLGVGARGQETGDRGREAGKAAGSDSCPLPPDSCFPGHARDAGTVACLVAGMLRGAHIFRVHNVRAAAQAVRALEPLLQ